MPSPELLIAPSESREAALARAASIAGVEPVYHDIWGREHHTTPQIAEGILRGLGLPHGSREELDAASEDRLRREWARPLPPTLVVRRTGAAMDLALRLPQPQTATPVVLEVEMEDGSSIRHAFHTRDLPVEQEVRIGGDVFVEKNVRLAESLPFGYHTLTLEIGGQRFQTRLIVCPVRAWQPTTLREGGRLAGIGVHLPGLRSSRNWGCGDFTDLEALIDWSVDEAGAAFIALNPLHSLHNRQPFNTSPYLPNTVYYRNLLYIDVERVPDFQASRRAQHVFASEACRREIAALRDSEFVEYERVQALKVRLLKLAFATFLRREWRPQTGRADRFRAFLAREGDLLHRVAVYQALDECIHADRPDVWVWTDWPAEFQDPGSTQVRRFADRRWRRVLFYQWLQWLIDEQLASVQAYAERRGMPIGLYHDLALATDRYGADLWAHRNFFVTGCRVGAPPDEFSPAGQDWAFPPPNSEHHRECGYELFVRSIRNNCRHGGALRMDHVMRFFRLYWIPEGLTAKEGAYVREQWEDYVSLLVLESVRNRVMLIGEDLGTVAPFIRTALHQNGILSYRLLYFEHQDDGNYRLPDDYEPQALCAITTHDLPTLAGFWTGRDIDARYDAKVLPDEASYRQAVRDRQADKQKMLDAFRMAGLLPEYTPCEAAQISDLAPELHNAAIGYLAATPCKLMLVNLEDLTKEVEQQNLPGTTWQHPNWRRKTRFSVEQLRSERMPRDCTRMLRNWLERTGRAAVTVQP